MQVLNKIKFVIDKITEVISTIILGIMTVLVVYQVIARFILNNPNAYTEALSQYLFVWLIMFGSAYVYGANEHLTIDLLKDKFSPTLTMIVDVITNIILFIFVLLICVIGGWMYTKGQAIQVDATLLISKSVLYVALPASGVITLYYAIYNCVAAVYNFKNGIVAEEDELGNSLV